MMLVLKKFENMKNIKTLLIILLGYLSFTALGSDTLYVRFNNFYVKDGATNDTLIFDVELKSFTAGTYLTAFQIDVNFNPDAFGSNAQPVAMSNLALVSSAMLVQVGPVNPNSSSFRVAKSPLFPPYNPASFVPVPTTSYAGLMQFKMLVLDDTEEAGIEFNIAAMTNNFKFVTTSSMSTYVPIVAENDLLNMPTTPTVFDLMISEVADPTGSNADFVEIYNAGSEDVDFSVFPWYLTTWDGANYDNVKLTGTLAAGDSYIIGGLLYAGGFPSIPADLTSDIVTGTGALSHYLSIYGSLIDGLFIDFYDGTSSSYTGKHAVRHYPIVAPVTTFDATEWVISDAANVDMTPGSHRMTLTWDGSGGTEWRDGQNWTAAYVPDAGHNVVIPNNGIVPVITSGDNAYAHDLTVNAGAGLVIESLSPGGDGSIITYGNVTGNASVKRYIGADRYYYITIPVAAANAGVYLHVWMFTYNETAGNWTPFIEPAATPLGLMKGYAVWSSSINSYYPGTIAPIGDTTVAYTGVLNSGNQSTALTYSAVGSSYGDGWNFVGNCYPSAVDWTATGWTKTGVFPNAYSVWTGTTYGTYTSGSGGTNGATQFIPAAQGYFVRTNAAGTLGVTNAVRAHSTQPFFKSEENMANRLSLVINNGDLSDETVIHFNENATTAIDYEYDAPKLLAPAAPQLYTMLGEEKMAINTNNNITETPSVKLGVNAHETGEFTISAGNMESFDVNTPIYLEDLLTSQIVNLKESGSYTFIADEGTAERFMVHFSEIQGIDDPSNSEITAIYANNSKVFVDFNGTRGEISIFNILGQEVSKTNADQGLNIVSVPQGNAVYIVKVVSDNSTVTKKVFVK